MNLQLGGTYLSEQELRDVGFLKLGKNICIHSRSSIYGVENISIGDNVRIDDFAVIIATGPLDIGNFVSIHNFCFIGSKYGLEIKDFVTLAPGVKIFTSSDDYHGEKLTGAIVPSELTGGHTGKVTIEKHAIIGAGSVVLPGCRIAEGCSVGALSLINRDLKPWGVYAGTPASRIKERGKRVLELEKELLQR